MITTITMAIAARVSVPRPDDDVVDTVVLAAPDEVLVVLELALLDKLLLVLLDVVVPLEIGWS